MNTTINLLIKKFLPYIFILLIAYLLNSVLFYFLPKTGINYVKNDDFSLDYQRYSGFYSTIIEVEKKEKKQNKKKSISSLNKYKLKAIYSKNDNSGWISIEEANGKKSHILSQWEEIDGYILTKLFKKYVIFEKAAKEYKLEISKEKSKVSYELTRNNTIKENIVVNNDVTTVKRDYLNSYVNDIDKVWNNISIKEIRKNNKIDGFKVNAVTKGSAFDKLGLKKGDIIKAINNKVLNSYADAFSVYNNINSTKYLNIEVLRNSEIMELNYEID